MKRSEYLFAAGLAFVVAVGLATNSSNSATACPNPFGSSVTALFAPCQTAESAEASHAAKPDTQGSVHDEQLARATQMASL
jgi:hypothetical protein